MRRKEKLFDSSSIDKALGKIRSAIRVVIWILSDVLPFYWSPPCWAIGRKFCSLSKHLDLLFSQGKFFLKLHYLSLLRTHCCFTIRSSSKDHWRYCRWSFSVLWNLVKLKLSQKSVESHFRVNFLFEIKFICKLKFHFKFSHLHWHLFKLNNQTLSLLSWHIELLSQILILFHQLLIMALKLVISLFQFS